MKKSRAVMRTVLCLISVYGQYLFAQYPAQIRIMTYNINYETHKSSGDYSDIASVIKEINPTIAGLQKLDSCIDKNKPLYVLKWLGEQVSMSYTFSTSIEKYSGSTGNYGIGFLSDSVADSSRRLWIAKGSSSEDRSALELAITMGGEKVRLIVTHLAYDGETSRTAQLQKIIPWIDEGGRASDPVVIMADFNAKPAENTMKLLENAGFSYVKGKNGVILDTSTGQNINHILYRPASRWKINDAGNPRYAASNRNPVWADMELLDPVSVAAHAVTVSRSAFINQYFSRNNIHYHLNSAADISLKIYKITGELVKIILDDNRQNAGKYTVRLADYQLSCGTYFYSFLIEGRCISGTASLIY